MTSHVGLVAQPTPLASSAQLENASPPSAPGPSAALRAAPRLAAAPAIPAPSPAPAPTAASAPALVVRTFAELVALAGEKRDIQMKTALERDVRLVRFESGVLEFSLAPGGSPALAPQLARKLQDWTGQRWMVALSSAEGAPSLAEQAEARENERRVGLQAHPFVRAALELFPGAAIVGISGGDAESAPAAPPAAPEAASEEVAYIDESEDEDF